MKKIILLLLLSINNISLKAQKIDSLKILCRDLYGESRGIVTKEMLLQRRYNNQVILAFSHFWVSFLPCNQPYRTVSPTSRIKTKK